VTLVKHCTFVVAVEPNTAGLELNIAGLELHTAGLVLNIAGLEPLGTKKLEDLHQYQLKGFTCGKAY
jgi:hypothetical protein